MSVNVTAQAVAQLKAIRSQVDALLALLDDGEPLPPAATDKASRVPPKGNRCPNCGVSNPKRETSGGFGSGEEKTYCGNCGHDL